METADKPRSGQPTASFTDANHERAGKAIRRERRVTVQNAVDALKFSYGYEKFMLKQ